jgi:hypothetical protein
METSAKRISEVRRSERPPRKNAEMNSTFCKAALTKCLYVWDLILKSGKAFENSIGALVALSEGQPFDA